MLVSLTNHSNSKRGRVHIVINESPAQPVGERGISKYIKKNGTISSTNKMSLNHISRTSTHSGPQATPGFSALIRGGAWQPSLPHEQEIWSVKSKHHSSTLDQRLQQEFRIWAFTLFYAAKSSLLKTKDDVLQQQSTDPGPRQKYSLPFPSHLPVFSPLVSTNILSLATCTRNTNSYPFFH